MKASAWAIALALALAGCSAPPPAPAPSASPVGEEHNTRVSEANACRALAGPEVAVQASAVAPGPELGADTQVRLALPADEVGLARFTPAVGGEWSLYLGHDMLVIVRQANGAVVPGLKLPGPDACEGLPAQRIYGLEAGATYQFEFGPTTARELAVVLTESHPGGAGEGAH